MKEAVFIILAIAVLLGLTAVRYRRQIVAFISFYKQLKAVRTNFRENTASKNQGDVTGIQLVKCSRCGKWIPETEVSGSGSHPVCRSGCVLPNAA